MRYLIKLALIFFLLFGITFVSSEMIIDSNDSYETKVYLEQGWNIIAGTIPSQGLSPNSQIKLEDIKAMFYYSPVQKKYLEIHPNPESDLQNEDDDFILTNAMWIYVSKSGTITYSTLAEYPALKSRQLYAGWNFVTLTPDMKHKLIREIKGNCEITRLLSWQHGEWQSFDYTSIENEQIADSDSDIGRGIVLRVSDDCTLGSNAVSPPQIPN